MNRRQILFCAVFVLPSLCAGQVPPRPSVRTPWTKVPVVTVISEKHDSRLKLTSEAVQFWNRTLEELGSAFRLGPLTRVDGQISAVELSTLSEKVLSRSGPPEFPDGARDLPGDLIVVLSDGGFVSFSARWPDRGKAVVGIRTHRFPPLSLPNVARNLVAHELGHAIGLGHNEDWTKLMCGRPAACRPDEFRSSPERYFPLTDAEKAELLRMYPADWKPGK